MFPSHDQGGTEDSDVPTIKYFDYRYNNVGGMVNKMIGYNARVNYYNLEDDTTINVNEDYYPLSDNSNKDVENIGDIVSHMQRGIQSDNVHQNYMKAELQNKYFKNDFFQTYLMVNMRPNFDLQLFNKVFIGLPSGTGNLPNAVHSGYYLVTGITHQISKEGVYQMMVTLCRNGYNPNLSYQDEFQSKLSGKDKQASFPKDDSGGLIDTIRGLTGL